MSAKSVRRAAARKLTSAQRKANRANAQKSRGPVSQTGKAIVSQNATKHGLCGAFHVLAWEEQQDYDNLLNGLMADEKPVGTAEVELVVKMAEHTWLAKRSLRMQEACFSMEETTDEQKARDEQAVGIRADLPDYLRYHTTHDRAYQRASKELRERRKERQIAERGFASQKRAEAEEARKAERHAVAMATAKANLHVAEVKAAKVLAAIMPPDFFPAPPSNTSLPNGLAASVSQNGASQASRQRRRA